MLFLGLMASLTHPSEDGTAQTHSGDPKESCRNLGERPKKVKEQKERSAKTLVFLSYVNVLVSC